MPAFKFRITFEDLEDVSRDIEIKPNQNFEEFHFAIQKAIGFDAKHKAEFYLSDDMWRKGKKVSFEKLSKINLVDVIDNPHQKFIYEYDEGNWSLYVELFKIVADESGDEYPRCIKSVGKAPKQYSKTDLKPPVSSLIDEDHTPLKDDENIDEARIYNEVAEIDVDSISDDDIETVFSDEEDETEDSNEEENEFGDEFGEEFGDNIVGDDFEEDY